MSQTAGAQLTILRSTIVNTASNRKGRVNVALDSMASESFITRRTAAILCLKLAQAVEPVRCAGLNGQETIASQYCTFQLGSPPVITITALVVDRICGDLPYGPQQQITKGAMEVDVLMSAADAWSIVRGVHQRKIGRHCQTVVDTALGECVVNHGPGGQLEAAALVTAATLSKQLERFFSLETLGIAHKDDDELPAEQLEAEELLQRDARYVDGHWEMPLLFKSEARALPNNFHYAHQRYLEQERKLDRDPELRRLYNVEIQALLDKETARVLEEEEIPSELAYYLPHRPVLRFDKETSQVRPVFDASAERGRFPSLNGQILNTKVVNPPLTGILMRFRSKLVALTGDVSKMFHKIHLHPDHIKYQRFLWRPQTSEPLRHYCITKTAFGLADSPYKANRAVEMTIERFGKDYPLASHELKVNRYVDDFLGGTDSEKEAVALQRECVELLSKADMQMRKWVSSSKNVMNLIPEELRGETGKLLLTRGLLTEEEQDEAPRTSALGVEWNVELDIMEYTGFATIEVPTENVTKRVAASYSARFFDPLGIISPVIITSKLILQRTWAVPDMNWKDPLSPGDMKEWAKWAKQIPAIKDISYRRCFVKPKPIHLRRLVGFGDASDVAIGTAVYIVIEYEDGEITSDLLYAKAKVAPLSDSKKGKKLTLPRKELIGMKITADAVKHAMEEMQIAVEHVHCFTDSMTALMWVRKPPRAWKLWVANRVRDTTALVPVSHWNHVAGVSNPADKPSRGVPASELVNDQLWFHGPDWLVKPHSEWPKEELPPVNEKAVLEEMKGPKIEEILALPAVKKDNNTLIHLRKFSKMDTLLAVTAYVLRWRSKKTLAEGREEESLLLQEKEYALSQLIRIEQSHFFASEIEDLSNEEGLNSRSPLQRLTPFLDETGLLRVGGRLHGQQLSLGDQHPILLPKIKIKHIEDVYHTITGRLVWDAHIKNHHAGVDWLIAHLRDKYWLVHARVTVRAIVWRCPVCAFGRAKHVSQKMAPLPLARLETGACFQHCGVDFAGPLQVKGHKKPVKVYILLFTCMASRGLHLELTESLSTEAFFSAFRRFVALHGRPKTMYSDEGRSFVRAKKELIQLFKHLNYGQFTKRLQEEGIEWKLNTPKAPFRGGVWERLIRTVKETLKRVLGSRISKRHPPEMEDLRTILYEIQAILNDRPLVQPTSDLAAAPISPSILMYGRRLRNIPEGDRPPKESEADQGILRRWRERKAMLNLAWKYFFEQYVRKVLIPTPKKWTKEKAPLEVGDVVLMASEAPLREDWPRAIVVEIPEPKQTRDGLVRTVKLRIATGKTYLRPVQSVVKLELDKGKESEQEEEKSISSDGESQDDKSEAGDELPSLDE